MQTIITAHYGAINFVRTWAGSDGRHIGLLGGGGYAHVSGAPVELKRDLTDLIPSGKHLDDALEWWKHKDDPPEGKDIQRIMLSPDGGYEWEDGSPIESAADILNALPQGLQQEAVLAWFHTLTVKKKKQENMAKVHEGNRMRAAAKKKEEAEAKKAA